MHATHTTHGAFPRRRTTAWQEVRTKEKGVSFAGKPSICAAALATLRPNGNGPLSCDRSSNVFGDRLRRSPACWNVEPEGDPRPPRPIAGQV